MTDVDVHLDLATLEELQSEHPSDWRILPGEREISVPFDRRCDDGYTTGFIKEGYEHTHPKMNAGREVLSTEGMKYCSLCGEQKPLSAFWYLPSWGKEYKWCKECSRPVNAARWRRAYRVRTRGIPRTKQTPCKSPVAR